MLMWNDFLLCITVRKVWTPQGDGPQPRTDFQTPAGCTRESISLSDAIPPRPEQTFPVSSRRCAGGTRPPGGARPPPRAGSAPSHRPGPGFHLVSHRPEGPVCQGWRPWPGVQLPEQRAAGGLGGSGKDESYISLRSAMIIHTSRCALDESPLPEFVSQRGGQTRTHSHDPASRGRLPT